MLIWTYYNGWILFFGAEFTRTVMEVDGHGIRPKAVATPAPQQMAFHREESTLDAQPSETDRHGKVPTALVGAAAGAAVCGIIYWLSERAGLIKASVDKPQNI